MLEESFLIPVLSSLDYGNIARYSKQVTRRPPLLCKGIGSGSTCQQRHTGTRRRLQGDEPQTENSTKQFDFPATASLEMGCHYPSVAVVMPDCLTVDDTNAGGPPVPKVWDPVTGRGEVGHFTILTGEATKRRSRHVSRQKF